jgi:hypothetical protein
LVPASSLALVHIHTCFLCSGLIYADTSIGGKLHHQRKNQ